jgi:DNA-binding FadR family transcriptional regulator
LVEQLTATLLELIDTKRYRPGHELPSSAELCSRYGVSRPVAREALKALQARGIIEIANGKKARLKAVDSTPLQGFFSHALRVEPAQLGDFMEVRRALEIESARLAAARRSAQELEELRGALVALISSLDNVRTFAKHDVRFHELIAGASHNPMLAHLIRSVRSASHATIVEGRRRRATPSALTRVRVLHQSVFRQIEAGDPEAAARAMHLHFDEAAMAIRTPKE